MKLKFDKIHYESRDGFTDYENRMRYALCYHHSNRAELKTAAKMLQRWGMTNSVTRFIDDWRNLFWVVTGTRGCRQHLAALEAMPRWIYGGSNMYRHWCKSARRPDIGNGDQFTGGGIFDHLRLFRNADGSKRLLVCMDYPEDDIERLRRMAERYGLHFALVDVVHDDGQIGWAFNCLANFELN